MYFILTSLSERCFPVSTRRSEYTRQEARKEGKQYSARLPGSLWRPAAHASRPSQSPKSLPKTLKSPNPRKYHFSILKQFLVVLPASASRWDRLKVYNIHYHDIPAPGIALLLLLLHCTGTDMMTLLLQSIRGKLYSIRGFRPKPQIPERGCHNYVPLDNEL